MNIKQLNSLLLNSFSQKERPATYFIFGAPGVGKTSIIAQIAKELGKELITLSLPTCESIDLRGLPYQLNGKTKWASPFPKDGEGILLLDEVSSAPMDVQVAAHHIVWAEEGSDMSLPKGWHIILTGNRATDKTIYKGLSGPLRNRLTFIDLDVSLVEWVKWAEEKGGIDVSVIGFLKFRPELLSAKEVPDQGAFTSPRSWESVNNILNLNVTSDIEYDLLEGTIGKGAAKEFVEFLMTYRNLPSIQNIIDNPLKVKIPESPALLYALTMQLSNYTITYGISAMEYIQRAPSEFTLLYIKKVLNSGKFTNEKDPLIKKWIESHHDVF